MGWVLHNNTWNYDDTWHLDNKSDHLHPIKYVLRSNFAKGQEVFLEFDATNFNVYTVKRTAFRLIKESECSYVRGLGALCLDPVADGKYKPIPKTMSDKEGRLVMPLSEKRRGTV